MSLLDFESMNPCSNMQPREVRLSRNLWPCRNPLKKRDYVDIASSREELRWLDRMRRSWIPGYWISFSAHSAAR